MFFITIKSLYEPLSIICWIGDLAGAFSRENTPNAAHRPTKTSKQEKWWSWMNYIRMANAFILCDLLWKSQRRHATNKGGSFKASFINAVVYSTTHYWKYYVFTMCACVLINIFNTGPINWILLEYSIPTNIDYNSHLTWDNPLG